jgi:tetratricopeptide (TPR) repeat protein
MRRFLFLVTLALLSGLLPGVIYAQDVKTLVDRGVANLESGKFDQALADFNAALKLKPNDAALYDYRGVAYRCKGMDDQALQDFNKAIQLDPRFARAYRDRAMVHFDRSDFDKSVEDLDKAQSLGYRLDQDFVKMVRRKAAEKK